MTAIPVVTFPPGDQWDQTLLDDLLAGALWPHGLEFESTAPWPDTAGVTVVIPGRYWANRTAEITQAIARYSWVLAFRCGDEEDLLDISEIHHPNIRWWTQSPRHERGGRFLPLGYTPHFSAMPTSLPDKTRDVVLVGQCTHERRRHAFDALARVARTKYVQATDGFTRGLPAPEYRNLMVGAKVAPCPAGPASPDTFRVYEALEAHTIPIVDDLTPGYDSRGYWQRMFPGSPLPTLTNYIDLPGYIDDALRDWPRTANRITSWWMSQKRQMAAALRADLTALGAGVEDSRPPVTVLITTSVVRSHPSTQIIDETVASVRDRLPDAEIIIAFDGVRAEQADRADDYAEYIRRVLWKADHEWRNVLPLIADEHLHQAVCVKRALAHVRTPVVLMVEHDTPLCGDIPWRDITDVILAGDANLVRMAHETSILQPHRYLMLDDTARNVGGVPMQRTIQWSQRPHFASVAWYQELLDRWFPNDERDFVEDRLYGKLITAHDRYGDMGWLGWRTFIYTPDGDIKRSYHTDGRAGEGKFDSIGPA